MATLDVPFKQTVFPGLRNVDGIVALWCVREVVTNGSWSSEGVMVGLVGHETYLRKRSVDG